MPDQKPYTLSTDLEPGSPEALLVEALAEAGDPISLGLLVSLALGGMAVAGISDTGELLLSITPKGGAQVGAMAKLITKGMP